MVNTVGSCENKHWYKKWIPIKNSLVLDSKQRLFIIGSLLGDGTMWLGKGAQHVNFKVDHGLAQKEYVYWKYEILKPFVFTEPKISYRKDGNGNEYEKSWWFRTIRHPLFTEIYKKFYEGNGYKNGRKIIPLDIEKELNPFVLAVWIMDDGSYSKGSIDISTYCFSLEEINRLQHCFKNKYCNQEETKKLIKTISPYIIPSMRYKIGFATP